MRSLVAAVVVAALSLAGCASPSSGPTPDVVASFYPIEFLARSIGGPDVSVGVVVPAGVEPHEYEPTPGDLARIVDAKLVLIQSAGFESWIQKAATRSHEARIASITSNLTLLDNPDEDEADELPQDPHTWLDPALFQAMARNVAHELSLTFPEHSAAFETRLAALQANLSALDEDFQAGLADCDARVIVTNHAAFQYLARRYDFTMIAISGLEPEAEPTPQALQEVVDQVRAHNVTIVFFEDLVSPEVAQAVAREAGAQTRVLSPIEGILPEEAAEGATYETKMRDNLANLRDAMRCR